MRNGNGNGNGNGSGMPLLVCEADRDVGRLIVLAAERFGLAPQLYEGGDHGCELEPGPAGAQVVLICGAERAGGCASHAHLAKPFTLAELEHALGEAVAKSSVQGGQYR